MRLTHLGLGFAVLAVFERLNPGVKRRSEPNAGDAQTVSN